MRENEKGEVRLSSIFSIVVFIAICLAAWNVGPVYIDHYALQDKMNELARAPRWSSPDEKIMDQLTRFARERRMDGYVKRSNFTISTHETSRRITVEYDRPAKILPGWDHTFSFKAQVDQPLV